MQIYAILLGAFCALTVADKPSVNPTYVGKSEAAAPSSKTSTASKTAQSKSDVVSAGYSAAQSPGYAQSSPGDVGTQGYYYYYYPVGNNGAAPNPAHGVTPYTTDEVDGAGIAGLFSGKALLIGAMVLGVIALLALGGISINLGGRSLSYVTDYAYENFDQLTDLAIKGIDLYTSLNEN